MVERATSLLPRIAAGLRRIARSNSDNIASLGKLEVRIIVELLLFGRLTMVRLVEILGNEKAQVSRTLRTLLERRLIRRDTLRSPIILTSAGESLAQTIVANAREDAVRMLAGLSASERDTLTAALPHLWQAAYDLLAAETRLRGKGRGVGLPQIDYWLMQETSSADLLTLRISTVGTLLQRSFFLACRRLTGLAASEVGTLSNILDQGPLLGKELSILEGRPKAQTDRTAHALTRSELVTRTRALDSHDWVYDVTVREDKIGMDLRRELDRREGVLLARLPAGGAEDVVSVLQRIFTSIASEAVAKPRNGEL